MTEVGIHDVIAHALNEAGIAHEREYRLTASDRPDFFLVESGFAIEVKKEAMCQGDLRQIGRYLEHPDCNGCIAIGLRISGIPSEFVGKPIHQIALWKLLL
jgi:hypothetical protein